MPNSKKPSKMSRSNTPAQINLGRHVVPYIYYVLELGPLTAHVHVRTCV